MTDLYSKTMGMLEVSHQTPTQICKATGLGRRWLIRLMQGDFGDPGVKKIQKLHDYLLRSSKSNEAA